MADPGTGVVTMTAEERKAQILDQYGLITVLHPAFIDVIRAAEQEAAVQARSEADVKWANELSRLLADGEQVAEQRGAERTRDDLYDVLRDQWGFSIGNTERLIKALEEADMSDTTERPPAREVLRESLAKAWPREGPDAADTILADLAAAGYPVEAMHAQLADIEEHGTAEINHAVALRGLLVEAIGLLRVIGDAADGPAGQKFPVTVQKGRHLTATHVAKCAALVDRARNAVTTTPPSFEAGPALVEALEHVISWWDRGLEDPFDIGKIRAALALAKQEPAP